MFYFDKIPTGKAVLTVTHLNFITSTQDVEVTAKTRVNVNFIEKDRTLIEVRVTASVPLITMKGDTLRFNAAAVKLMEGDLALEILKQIPGVEISSSGISVLGQNIAKTYVNKRMIFGRDQMAALTNMPASEVLSIDTYEEYAIADSTLRSAGDRKQRVLNIRTKNPIISAISGHALASYGHDIDPDGRNRYGIGATGNFFSENLLLSVNALSNNINRSTNRMADIVFTNSAGSGYLQRDHVNLSMEKNRGSNYMLDWIGVTTDYIYNRSYSQTGNIRQYLYLPSPEYQTREYADTAKNESTHAMHQATLGFRLAKQAWGGIDYKVLYQNSDNNSFSNRSARSALDENDLTNSAQNSASDQSYHLQQSITMWGPYGKKLTGSINANYGYSDTNGEGIRVDSLSSTGLKRVLESGPIGRSSSLGIGGQWSYDLSKTSNLKLTYRFSVENSHRLRFATDMTDMSSPRTDSINTYDYSTGYNTHIGNLAGTFTLWKKWKLLPSLSFQSSATNREESFPEAQHLVRRQNALLPADALSLNEAFKNMSIQYSTQVQLPSLEQWRARLDNRDPYRLIAGNPDLKQSYTHLLSLNGYLIGKHTKTISMAIDVSITQNTIVEHTCYFTQDTPLPAWNHYIAPAQSVLTSYENLNGRITGRMATGYSQSIQSFQSLVSIATELGYQSFPSYIQNTLNNTQNFTAGLNFSIRSSVCKGFRFVISSKNAYVYTTNTIGQNNKVLNVGGFTTTETKFLKYFQFKTRYNLQYYKRLTDLNTHTAHEINAVLSFRLLKGNMEMSLSAFDLLNASSRFSTVMQNDYILNSWSESSGRYFSFNMGYKFYQSKSKLKQPKNMRLKDGSTPESASGRNQ